MPGRRRETRKAGWVQLKRERRRGLGGLGLGKAEYSDSAWLVLCVHDERVPLLETYERQADARSHRPQRVLDLLDAAFVQIDIADERAFTIGFTADRAPVHLSALSPEERQQWVTVLDRELAHLGCLQKEDNLYGPAPLASAAQPSQLLVDVGEAGDGPSGSASPSQPPPLSPPRLPSRPASSASAQSPGGSGERRSWDTAQLLWHATAEPSQLYESIAPPPRPPKAPPVQHRAPTSPTGSASGTAAYGRISHRSSTPEDQPRRPESSSYSTLTPRSEREVQPPPVPPKPKANITPVKVMTSQYSTLSPKSPELVPRSPLKSPVSPSPDLPPRLPPRGSHAGPLSPGPSKPLPPSPRTSSYNLDSTVPLPPRASVSEASATYDTFSPVPVPVVQWDASASEDPFKEDPFGAVDEEEPEPGPPSPTSTVQDTIVLTPNSTPPHSPSPAATPTRERSPVPPVVYSGYSALPQSTPVPAVELEAMTLRSSRLRHRPSLDQPTSPPPMAQPPADTSLDVPVEEAPRPPVDLTGVGLGPERSPPQTEARPRTLREEEVERLRAELGQAVKLTLDTADARLGLGLVEARGAVWVAGWRKELHRKLSVGLHFGDEVLEINGQAIRGLKQAEVMLRTVSDATVLVAVRRLTYGQVFLVERATEEEGLGLELDGGRSGALRAVAAGSPAGRAGVPAEWPAEGGRPVASCVTEVNGRPLGEGLRGGEAEQRLRCPGRQLSLVLQPKDFVKELRHALRHRKHAKHFVL